MKKVLFYLLIVVLGLLLIFGCSFLQQVAPYQKGEYFYSSFLNNNFTVMTAIVLSITAMLIVYFLSLNPFLVGLSLVAIYPITATIEATVYKETHNLIPLEFAIYFLYAIPLIVAGYLAFLIKKLINNKKAA